MEIFKEFKFDAAHYLPNVPVGHKCGRLHGHTYRLLVTVEGEIDPHTGFVMDFGDLKKAVQPVVDEWDHSCLNDCVSNPTAENLVLHLWSVLSHLPVTAIELWETPTSGARKRALPG